MTKPIAVLRIAVCSIALFARFTYAQQPAADKTGEQLPNDYSSPQAVFNSFRASGANRDFRRSFRCFTPSAQKRILFELYFRCAESGSGEARQIVGTHIGDRDKFREDYSKKYQLKYGKAPPPPGMGGADMDLFKESLFSCVTDKAGLYAAVNTFFLKEDGPSPIGNLEDLVVTGDTATGRATVTVSSIQRSPAEADKKNNDQVYKTYEFRKVNGEWLID